jgi:hypothetical protein
MLEIVALYFLCKTNGGLAERKGLKPLTWKLYTIFAWVVCECVGLMIAFSMFDKTNLFPIFGLAVFCAFGGYLFVRKALENKPDAMDDDINSIGVDDLAPPKK